MQTLKQQGPTEENVEVDGEADSKTFRIGNILVSGGVMEGTS